MSLWNVGAQSIAPSQENVSASEKTNRLHYPRWQTILFWLVILALVAVAVGMRLYDLGLPFDRDTYDEGVYWQSLRAMSAGHPLYQQTFYSQPPFFLLSTFPSYVLFGGTLWSARFGIALVSLFGLVGAFLLGKALSGRLGAIAALLLVVVNPVYLAQSQTIQAEVSCAAFSLLAVGLGFLWWEHPASTAVILSRAKDFSLSSAQILRSAQDDKWRGGIRGIVLAGLAGVTLSLSILCKLFGVAALAPLTLLMLTRLWQIWKRSVGRSVERSEGSRPAPQRSEAERVSILRSGVGTDILPIVVGIGSCILTILLVMLPFVGSLKALFQSVIFFHTGAATVASSVQQGNISIIEHALYSILTLAALYGTLAAFLRRDWRVLPLLAWLFVTIFLLWRQVPLFGHHLVVLIPPLIALTVIGIGRMPATFKAFLPALAKYTTWLTILSILLILVTGALDIRQDRQYYRVAEANSVHGVPEQEAGQLAMRAAADLRQAITSDQLVVTDAQFVAALADRSTPPSLVDTSQVRISSGYLTLSELIDTAAEPQVHAVLFFTGRFQSSQVAAFHDWVAHNFHLLHNYGGGKELWVR